MASSDPLLSEFEQIIQKFNPVLYQKLNEGLSEAEIDQSATTCRLDFPSELYNLFTWRNGVQHGSTQTDELLLFPNGIPLTLAEANNSFVVLALQKHSFEPVYFPLFSGGEESLLLIDLDEESSAYKMIHLYDPAALGDTTPITIFDSFRKMLETVIACYTQEAFGIVQNGLQVNQDAYYSIAGNLNPNSQYWHYM